MILLVAVTSGIVIWSLQALKKEIEARTLSYVSDVSGQLALDIDHHLTKAVTSLDVITATVDLVRKLGAKTVAEGIETPEQLQFIERIQCDMIQGYIYSKPLSIPEFEIWSSQYQEDTK